MCRSGPNKGLPPARRMVRDAFLSQAPVRFDSWVVCCQGPLILQACLHHLLTSEEPGTTVPAPQLGQEVPHPPKTKKHMCNKNQILLCILENWLCFKGLSKKPFLKKNLRGRYFHVQTKQYTLVHIDAAHLRCSHRYRAGLHKASSTPEIIWKWKPLPAQHKALPGMTNAQVLSDV